MHVPLMEFFPFFLFFLYGTHKNENKKSNANEHKIIYVINTTPPSNQLSAKNRKINYIESNYVEIYISNAFNACFAIQLH